MDSSKTKIPVILDTDIGTDIDDTWALAMMLKSPELDVKLITSTSDDTVERAKIIAKMLTIAGRTDIPIGVGVRSSDASLSISPWVKDFDMSAYKGTVHKDGVQAVIDTVAKSRRPVTLICIGPLTNIAEVLRSKPDIAPKIRLVGMQGSVYRGYENSDKPSPEYNIVRNIPAAKKVFAADWMSMVITPLDTCGVVRLEGDRYKAVQESKDPLIKAVIESYNIWLGGKAADASSVIFDTVAIYLSFSQDLLNMKSIGIRVTDDAFTKPDDTGKPVNCAVVWKDLPAFHDFLVERLTGQSASGHSK